MKIVADENMPLVEKLFSPYGEVETFAGRELSADHVSDADVLLIRSVTQVNKALLEGSQVQFVGSATIGTDHVDQHYLQQQGIRFANAPGCNANGVVQYVLSVLFSLRADWMKQTVGIIGCGNVGGRLYRTLQALGVDCCCYDPFLESFPDKENNAPLVSFDDVLQSDILCLHTPLTSTGKYPTYHLLNGGVLAGLADNTLLVNAGRGAVIDNQALLHLLPQRNWQVALDVWEHEPNIMLPLLEQVDIGTPHIAGYSYDGKVNGTWMVCEAFCGWRGIDTPKSLLSQESTIELSSTSLSGAVLGTFDVTQEDRRMRDALLANGADVAKEFDRLRKTCPKRLEFQHYQLEGGDDGLLAQKLGALKFNII